MQIHMLQDNTTCKVLCTEQIPPEDGKFINDRIREDYAINWLVDGLPAAEMKEDKKTGEIFFDMGFNLGYDEGEFKEMPALHNHYDIVLRSVSVQFHAHSRISDRASLLRPPTCILRLHDESRHSPHACGCALITGANVVREP